MTRFRIRQFRWFGTLVWWTLLVAVMLALGLGALAFRLSTEGRRQMTESDVHFNAGRLTESLVAAKRAADLYVPLAPHVKLADGRLDSIAIGAESHQLAAVSLLAWQSIRSAELKRSVWGGRNTSRLALATRRTKELLASSGDSGGDLRGEVESAGAASRAAQEAGAKEAGAKEAGAKEAGAEEAGAEGGGDWGQVASLGLLLLGSVVVVSSRGRPSGGKWKHWTVVGGLLVVIGVMSWTFCLAFA